MDWPPLQGQEIAHLKEHFGSAQQLRASFDSESEVRDLICLFWPGILLQWSKETERADKRRRREVLRGALETLTTRPARPDLAQAFDQSTRDNPLVLLEAEERLARERYALLLAGFIKETRLLTDPDSAWKRLFDAQRSKTLRNRFKAWSNFRM